jgi:hypothetical protein
MMTASGQSDRHCERTLSWSADNSKAMVSAFFSVAERNGTVPRANVKLTLHLLAAAEQLIQRRNGTELRLDLFDGQKVEIINAGDGAE